MEKHYYKLDYSITDIKIPKINIIYMFQVFK